MIIGPDFVWLHFPKCAGVAVHSALRKLYGDRDDIRFDDITKPEIIWHQSVTQRLRRDPASDLLNKKIICCIRRLPDWMLSRVHFEVSRPPHHVATREMIEAGQFFEQDGQINHADLYASMYSEPRVDHWVRTEHLADDLAFALSIEASAVNAALTRENETGLNYLKKTAFWFTGKQLDRLYAACPVWADIEEAVYGR